MNILVTGASGFVGQSLVNSLIDTKHNVVAGVRKIPSKRLNSEYRIMNDLEDKLVLTDVFEDIDIVVHAAARVHIMNDKSADPLTEFRKVNVEGTLNLAQQAAEAGVKRFIFLSSIKVNGEATQHGKPYTADSRPNPTDPYGVSKFEAEQGLLKIADQTDLEVVIIRPTLVYGENVKGNFQSLMKWTYKGLPLPLAGIDNNLRSLVSIDNLTDFILTCIDHENAKNEVFLVSDDQDISTAQMLEEIAKGLGVKNKAIKIPTKAIKMLAKVAGKPGVADRLCGSLQVDIEKTKIQLDWQPPFSTHKGIEKAAQSYIKDINKNSSSLNDIQRALDIIFAFIGLAMSLPVLITILAIGYFDTGSPLFIQERVGKDQKPFKLIKFRTMNIATASVASHLVDGSAITKFGKFLRKTKLDELPQLINVLKGDMSFVGPRPNLFNQQELIAERDKRGVYDVLPGITGLAQINNIDMSTPKLLAETDETMIKTLSVKKYFSYIAATALGRGTGDAVKQLS